MAKKPLEVAAIRHRDATRLNIPTVEYEGVMRDEDKSPVQVAYQRRNRDLDPQLVWRGKDEQDWSDLVVAAPPLYIQEKVHPKVLIDDLRRESSERRKEDAGATPDLFADFNGLADKNATTEFYQHAQHWSNRMISGDSLAVMASLAEREGMRGKVQCIYFDPPYGIKFNSNFQWSTTSKDVKDGTRDHMSREPEMVRAFRDTWRDGIHSYLTYLRDRLVVARDLLTETGSLFVQIGDENVHRVRALMDEVFGEDNFISTISFQKTTAQASGYLPNVSDHLLWYAKSISSAKFRQLYTDKAVGGAGSGEYVWIRLPDGSSRTLSPEEKRGQVDLPKGAEVYRQDSMVSQGAGSEDPTVVAFGKAHHPGSNSHWKTHKLGVERLVAADRVVSSGRVFKYKRYINDFSVFPLVNNWRDTGTGGSSTDPRIYVVQTATKVIERCILMATDPGDIVLDPTCGSGTTAYVAEQWGRRWITIDTSRVSLALARSRIMGARYQYYILADSIEGQRKEAEITRSVPKTTTTHMDVRQGFVYERVPHIMLKDIANNTEIDVIWEKWQHTLEPLRKSLNAALATAWEHWDIPHEPKASWPADAASLHKKWWSARIARQNEIDASVAAKADVEYLYDRPFPDSSRVRVAGPFTVESLSPHRTLAVGADDELIDPMRSAVIGDVPSSRDATVRDFTQMILENLRVAGVQQMEKSNKISFTGLAAWPGGGFICAEAVYMEGADARRAGIFIGPEFGSISRADLVAAAKEAGEAGFDVLVACAFNYDATSTEFDRLGRIPVLKARMNPDLMMAKDLKTTTSGNLFVVFGEPDIKVIEHKNGRISVQVFGVDVFKPQTGEVVPAGIDGIALWMIDTDYNEESFFVRHAYFLGANDPYKALKTTLRAEIDEAAWQSLYSDTSRPFPKPKSGRIAVKVINHLGDEVMKVVGIGK